MDPKREVAIYKKYPALYRQKDLPMTHTCMCWGLAVGNGWAKIIDTMSKRLTKYAKDTGMVIEVTQVKEKFGCYDTNTEVLTQEGWKFFKDVQPTDLIATLNANNELVYNLPLDIIKYKHTGKMYKLETRGVDLLVTPNHNLYVAKGSYYNGKYKPCKKIDYAFKLETPDKKFGKNKRFLKSASWKGVSPTEFVLPGYTLVNKMGFNNAARNIAVATKRTYIHVNKTIPMLPWVKFLGFYVAEGCADAKRGAVSICACNVDGGTEKMYVNKLIQGVGYIPKAVQLDKSAMVWRIYDKKLAIWLVANCGHGAKNKRVPGFIKELSPNLIAAFLEALYMGDGHQAKTSHILTTVSKKLADDVQELILKVGASSTCYPPRMRKASLKLCDGRIITPKFPSYEINWMKFLDHNTKNQGIESKIIEQWVDYDDWVYCVTVPNHVIFIRRNGKGTWCGNSLRVYLDGNDDTTSKILEAAERDSAVTCEECGKPGKINKGPWYSVRCPSCRAKENK